MMKKIKNMIRQGDVLLIPVNSIPQEAINLPTPKKITLAEGEASGHSHTITAPKNRIRQFAKNSELYLEVLEPVTLIHQEHAPATINPGMYLVRRQMEFWLDEVRQVLD